MSSSIATNGDKFPLRNTFKKNTISKLQVEFFFFIRDMEMIFLHICCVVKDTSLIQIL